MKAKAIYTAALTWLLASATPVLAAEAVREDHSGILVWAFLGFCAVIVIAQLLPAVLLLTGMVKGLVAPRESATEKASK